MCLFIINEISKLCENQQLWTSGDGGLSHLMRQGPFLNVSDMALIFIAVVPTAMIQKVGLMTSCKYLCSYILN